MKAKTAIATTLLKAHMPPSNCQSCKWFYEVYADSTRGIHYTPMCSCIDRNNSAPEIHENKFLICQHYKYHLADYKTDRYPNGRHP